MRPFPSRVPLPGRRFATVTGSFRKTPNAPAAALPFESTAAKDAGRVALRVAVTGPVYVTTVPFFSVYEGPAGRGRAVGAGVAGASVGSGVGSGVGAAVGAIEAGTGLVATTAGGAGVAAGVLGAGGGRGRPPTASMGANPARGVGGGWL